MRVLIFVWHSALQDDLHDNIADTAEFLHSQGHQVTLVCPTGPFVQRMTALGVDVCDTDYENWDAFIATDALAKGYDIIHAHPGPARVWGLKAQEKLGIPFFVTFHGHWIDNVNEYSDRCAGIFAVSSAVRQKVLDVAPSAADRVHDMPNFVAPTLPKTRTSPDPRGPVLRILAASRFDQDKEGLIDVLLGVWKFQAERKEAMIRWEIAGIGTELVDSLKAAAAALSDALGENVVNFHGSVEQEELSQIEASCQVSVSPGRSAIASLAAGIPTIALASSGCFGLVTCNNFWEAARCNFGGFGMTKPAHPSKILNELQNFLDPKSGSLRAATDCSKFMQSYFSRNLWGDRLLAHYMKALKRTSDTALAVPFMPRAEIEYLSQKYAEASVILEYGSGGSTEIAVRMPGKYIMSVESDIAWARQLRQKLSASSLLSQPVIYHADIGPTGPWGRPLNDSAWRKFHLYPNSVWDQNWFRHPDVVLIDGRFRTACLATVLLRAKRPVRVLFDDYGVRPLYHQIEEVIKPVRMIGRMAEFQIEPGLAQQKDVGLLLQQFFWVSLHGMSELEYQVLPPRDNKCRNE